MQKITLIGGTNNGIIADVPDLVIESGILKTYERGTVILECYLIEVTNNTATIKDK